ncbi:hypothetical protein ACIBF1_01800 [Spirillospora sp. NPDC050679]
MVAVFFRSRMSMTGSFGLPLPMLRRAAAVAAGAALGAAIVMSGGPATAHQVAVAKACGGTAFPAFTGWGPESVSGCSHAGHPGSTLGIRWHAHSAVCLQAQGGDGRWHMLGCAARGQGSVPWGNVVGTPKVKIQGPNSAAWAH